MRAFSYTAPSSVAEAVEAIAAAGGGAKFLAGGTTLFDLMKLGVEQPPALIDVSRLAELTTIDTSRGDHLVFGGGARMGDVAADPLVRRDYPVLSESLWRAASQQLRNMATVAGNLLQRTRCPYFRDAVYPCNKREPGTGCSAIDGISRGHAILGVSEACIAVYPGDWAVALAAFDAVIDVAGPQGTRSIPLLDLHLPPGTTPQRETILEPDELITRVRVPVTRAGKASTYQKIRDRESYAFALTSAAVALEFADGRVRDARIALGGVATTPWRARSAEQTLLGLPQPVTEAAARRAGEIAFADAHTTKLNAFKIPLGIQTVVESVLIAQERSRERA